MSEWDRGMMRRLKWAAFWWGFTHPFADPRQSRDLTHHEERILARSFTHAQRPWWSCWSMSRRFCVRCMWRDLTGANRRAKRRYAAEMHERANSIPPTAVRRYRRGPNGSWERAE